MTTIDSVIESAFITITHEELDNMSLFNRAAVKWMGCLETHGEDSLLT